MTDTADKTPERKGHCAQHVAHVATCEHPTATTPGIGARIAQERWSHAYEATNDDTRDHHYLP